MARGFESKSVQDQQSDEPTRDTSKTRKKADEIEREKRLEDLDRTKTRIEREMAETTSELRRQSLRAALAWVETEIAKSG